VARVSRPGSERSLDVVALGAGRYHLIDNGRARIAYAAAASDTWVFLDGRVFVVPAGGTAVRRAAGDEEAALTAPMPATVVTIHVSPGQEVARDGLLITLEAMKMELPIKAPRAGRVTAVSCRPGELVQPGVRLMEIDYGT